MFQPSAQCYDLPAFMCNEAFMVVFIILGVIIIARAIMWAAKKSSSWKIF